MEELTGFLLRASVYLFIFGAGYYLFLAKLVHTDYKRFFILLTFVGSVLLATAGKIQVSSEAITGDLIRIMLPEFVVSAEPQEAAAAPDKGWFSPKLIYFLPLVFSMAFFFFTLLRLMRIFRTIRRNPREKYRDMELVLLEDHYTPFSFFKWIFVPASLKKSEHFDKVITHETAHYTHRHSWDILFMEIMRMLFWFHPMYYYLRNQLEELHEYDADKKALKIYSRPEYQRALLDCALGAHYLPVTNPFNVSTIKKRFIMMSKKENLNIKALIFRSVIVVPFLVIAFFIQSCEVREKQELNNAENSGMIEEETVKSVKEVSVAEEPIFVVVEDDPQFPGGQAEMMKFLSSNLRYPDKARIDGAEGTIFITFVVEKDGRITGIKLLRGVSPELDNEALRVVKMMPAWIPGKQRGETVRVQYNIPIRFVLN
jgi:TonB family protein